MRVTIAAILAAVAVLGLTGCTCHLIGTQTVCFDEPAPWIPGPSWEVGR